MPPKNKDQYSQIRAETKEKIFNHAIKVFAQKGFHATLISDIAKNADISVGLMYRYFASKQELFEEIINFAITGIKYLTDLFLSDQDPLAVFREVSRQILEDLDNPDYINLNIMVFSSLIHEVPPYNNEVAKADEALFKAAEQMIKQGQTKGVFSSGSPRVKALSFFSLIQGLTQTKFFLKDDFTKPMVDDLMKIVK